MESTQLTTDNLRNTMATVEAMRTANKELKRQYGKIDVDKIDVNIFVHSLLEDLLICLYRQFMTKWQTC
jgi:charged multivesicular body protein 5